MEKAGAAESPLTYAVSHGIATITLNRPEKLNAFTDEMLGIWAEALESAREDDAVRAIVLTGSGRGFCSGADFSRKDPSVAVTPVSVKERAEKGLQRIPMIMSTLEKPVIAAINGVAAGAGLDLALMCDIRFAAQSATFAEVYARLGLLPGAGGAYFLPRLVGVAKALEMFWGTEYINTEEALRIGLINRVYPDADLMAETYAFATKVAEMPPLSIRLVKRAVYQSLDTDLKTSLDLTSSHLSIARTSRDSAEAMTAFREKRKGVYEGR